MKEKSPAKEGEPARIIKYSAFVFGRGQFFLPVFLNFQSAALDLQTVQISQRGERDAFGSEEFLR